MGLFIYNYLYMKSRKLCFIICYWLKVILVKIREYSLVYVMCLYVLRGVIFNLIGVLKKYIDIKYEVNVINKVNVF